MGMKGEILGGDEWPRPVYVREGDVVVIEGHCERGRHSPSWL